MTPMEAQSSDIVSRVRTRNKHYCHSSFARITLPRTTVTKSAENVCPPLSVHGRRSSTTSLGRPPAGATRRGLKNIVASWKYRTTRDVVSSAHRARHFGHHNGSVANTSSSEDDDCIAITSVLSKPS